MEAASCRLYSFLLVNYLLLFGEKAHSVLNGIDAPTHNSEDDEETYNDNRNGYVRFHHVLWMCDILRLKRGMFELRCG